MIILKKLFNSAKRTKNEVVFQNRIKSSFEKFK